MAGIATERVSGRGPFTSERAAREVEGVGRPHQFEIVLLVGRGGKIMVAMTGDGLPVKWDPSRKVFEGITIHWRETGPDEWTSAVPMVGLEMVVRREWTRWLWWRSRFYWTATIDGPGRAQVGMGGGPFYTLEEAKSDVELKVAEMGLAKALRELADGKGGVNQDAADESHPWRSIYDPWEPCP
jgi:hypothetical protein